MASYAGWRASPPITNWYWVGCFIMRCIPVYKIHLTPLLFLIMLCLTSGMWFFLHQKCACCCMCFCEFHMLWLWCTILVKLHSPTDGFKPLFEWSEHGRCRSPHIQIPDHDVRTFNVPEGWLEGRLSFSFLAFSSPLFFFIMILMVGGLILTKHSGWMWSPLDLA